MDEDLIKNPMPTVVQWIAIKQAQRGLTDAELALKAGISDRVLRTIEEGKAKLSSTAIKGVARAVSADPRELLNVFLNDYSPEFYALLEELRMPVELTENERELLKRYRLIAKGRDATPVIVSGITLVFPKST